MRLLTGAFFVPQLLLAQTLAPHPVEAVRTGAFRNPAIRESSGVARSRVIPGVLYTINDSGNDPVVFAFDSSGRDLGHWVVPGVGNRDWEAMAIGPCQAGSCLYVGDIGDNAERRPSVTIYRVREPARLDAFRGSAAGTTLDLDSLTFRYPDAPHDAEAMWVDRAGTIFVVTKGRSGGIRLFRLSPDAFGQGRAALAELVQVVPIPPDQRFGRMVTDAALAPDGSRVAIRTYTELYLFPLLPLGRLGPPVVCNVAGLEPQGEGVEWLDDARLVLTSESVPEHGPGSIHVVRCGA
jgi:hypothetical protein